MDVSPPARSPARTPSDPGLSRAYSDRFIPSRTGSNLTSYLSELGENAPCAHSAERQDSSQKYAALLRNTLLDGASPGGSPLTSFNRGAGADGDVSLLRAGSGGSHGKNLFCFVSDGAGAGAPTKSPFARSPVGGDSLLEVSALAHKPARKIARSPFKVLDAPHLADDFYLNLVDWSSSNVLAVGMGACVYLWSASTCNVTKLVDLSAPLGAGVAGDTVTSVSWTQHGTYLAVGTTNGEVQLWDAARARRVRTLGGHHMRVASLNWCGTTLASGSRDRHILLHDVREPGDFMARLGGHRSEVCGLRWSPDGHMLASGGNDNALMLWSARATAVPRLRLGQHGAAVKALAWSPHTRGLLASGGGTADRCIRFWNTTTGTPLQCVDTGSQVCNLAWSKNCDEIVSTHGHSQNQIFIWRCPTMTKVATLVGHTCRVLYLAVSPDGQTIVTGAGDETLRFWRVFPRPMAGPVGADASNTISLGRSHVR